jgi:hypothetical protein
MGSSKQTSTSTTTPEMSAAEKQYQQMELNQYQQIQPYQTEMFKNAYGLGNQLLTSFGDQNSQMWQSLIGGVTPEQQQRMISEQQRYLNPQFQQNGIMDSGLAYTASLRSATDLANQNAQFNVGALQNALNLALSGQAQVQNPFQNQSNSLASQLAGLRSTTQTNSSTYQPSGLSMAMQGMQGVGGMMSGIGGFGMGMGWGNSGKNMPLTMG